MFALPTRRVTLYLPACWDPACRWDRSHACPPAVPWPCIHTLILGSTCRVGNLPPGAQAWLLMP